MENIKEEVREEQTSFWMREYWRPLAAMVYLIICVFDFLVAPVLWSILQLGDETGMVTEKWEPLTLGGGGLFHLSFGAILGVAAWTRGQEKVEQLHCDMELEKTNQDRVHNEKRNKYNRQA